MYDDEDVRAPLIAAVAMSDADAADDDADAAAVDVL